MDNYSQTSQLEHGGNFSVTDLSQHTLGAESVKLPWQDIYASWTMMLKLLSYNWPSVLNFLLSIFIVIHNSIIVRFYYFHGAGITQRFFFWIGIADIFAAVGMIVFSVSSALFFNGMTNQLPLQRGIIFFLLLFPAALACSRSLNVFVTMIKTINIASIAWRGTPVRMHNSALFIVSFATFLMWLTVNTSDVILRWVYWRQDGFGPIIEQGMEETLWFPSLVGGKTVAQIISLLVEKHVIVEHDHKFTVLIIITVFLIIHFALPTIITFICMIIQAHSIRSSIQQDSNLMQPSASHINKTIFMVAALFCFCHTTFLIYVSVFILHYTGDKGFNRVTQLGLVSFFEFTLPLFNAALFPLIIILRKQSLKERYRDAFLGVFSAARSGVGLVGRWCGGVVTWYGGVVTWVARTRRRLDYEELPSHTETITEATMIIESIHFE